MKQYQTFSEKETKNLAKKLAGKIKSGVVALTGELGAGKTTFVQGFAKGLGIKETIISPTFVLIRQHKLSERKRVLYHIDLYRLVGTIDIHALGIWEIISNPNNLILIEWAEKIENNLPEGVIKIKIKKKGLNKRLITIS